MAWWPDGGVWMMMTMTIISFVQAEEPYRFFDFRVTYGKVAMFENVPPFRVHYQQMATSIFLLLCICVYLFKLHMQMDMQVILINGKFPGPELRLVTNDNLIINVRNDLDEPFLLSWYLFLYLFRLTSS